MNIDLIILAAGNSSRMHSSTSKIFQELAGRPLIEYVIDLCQTFENSKTTIVTNGKHKDNPIFKDLTVCIQEVPNGTAGAVKSALSELSSEYSIVLCSDMPLVEKRHIQALLDDQSEISLIASRLPESLSDMPYGRVIVDDKNEFSKIVEYKDANESERKTNLFNCGIYKIKTCLIEKYINQIESKNLSNEYYLTDLINILKNNGFKISIVEEPEYSSFHGINTMQDLSAAEDIMQIRLRNKFMSQGTRFLDPKTTYLSYDTVIGKDVTIEQNVVIKKNVRINDGVTVKAFSYLADCELCDNSTVGPFARLRGNSKINENAAVGNFVEIKGSDIGEGTKIKHLSYIGDAKIGQNSNIGAGTITCNYDGVNKHKTTIGSNVMVGSNCSLIAPVEIQDDVLIGAASVVDKAIPAKSLVISRPELKIKENKIGEFFKKHQKKTSIIN